MERRSFLKLACIAVVAPSLLKQEERVFRFDAECFSEDNLSTATVYQIGPDGKYRKLMSFIVERRDAAFEALLDDLEASALLFNNGPKGLGNIQEWVNVSIPLNYR